MQHTQLVAPATSQLPGGNVTDLLPASKQVDEDISMLDSPRGCSAETGGGGAQSGRKCKASSSAAQQSTKRLTTANTRRTRALKRTCKEVEADKSETSGDTPKTSVMPTCLKKAPQWIENTLELCAVVGNGDAEWVGFVNIWLSLQKKKGFDGDEAFQTWWQNLQPEDRQDEEGNGWLMLSQPDAVDWSSLEFYGINGTVSIVVGLAWWREKVYKLPMVEHRQHKFRAEEVQKFEETLDDITYVFTELKR
ncbi:hypothetical protein BT96DRAFT_1001759 [Gymnopus androsaceus JB14]|uniref:Uncharacterized protein n=1 Tax=Gymnopus androsaceus JB14 TaxID=1447944 RepID=A0A6A4GZT4_9AGAR|nr:hypothetical protein BT96DRAFT_1001759 [Gymnopus androsaceus JB14]